MSRRSPGDPRLCPDCGVTAPAGDTAVFLSNGSSRCRECSRKVARARYPARRAEIAETRRKRRAILRESAADGDASDIIEAHRTGLRIRYWVKFGGPGIECDHVGQPWIAVADMLQRADLDREHLGIRWDIDFTNGFRLEDWRIEEY